MPPTTRTGVKKNSSKKKIDLSDAVKSREEEYRTLQEKHDQLVVEVKAGISESSELENVVQRMERLRQVVSANVHIPVAVPGTDTSRQGAVNPNTADTSEDVTMIDPRRSPVEVQEKKQKKPEFSDKQVVDDLGIEWDVDVSNTQSVSPLEGLEGTVIGHLNKHSTVQYVVRYGNNRYNSAIIESQMPEGSPYEANKDVTDSDDRILEKMLEAKRRRHVPFPKTIIAALKVYAVYWNTKDECGYATNLDVLHPSYEGRRPPTRCYVYVDPVLWKGNANYNNISNKSGFSHETRSTVKHFLKGKDDWARSITLYNIAVTRENEFEENFMQDVDGRPEEPLYELTDKRTSRQGSQARFVSIESAPSLMGRQNRNSPRSRRVQPWENDLEEDGYESKEESLPSTPRPMTHRKQTSSKSLNDQFLEEYCELFRLPPSTKYDDLSEKAKIMFPAQFTQWKKVNAAKN